MSTANSLSLSYRILLLNTLAFTLCFACWTLKEITDIHFSANMWVSLVLLILIGISWGIGKTTVYKHIPEYFPTEAGVVEDMVGMIGGFLAPLIFGYLLTATRVWSSSWIFILLLSAVCFIWMHITVTKIMNEKKPVLSKEMD